MFSNPVGQQSTLIKTDVSGGGSDQAGNGYVFKAGDTFPGGKVVSVGENSIVFELSQFGIVTKYEIVMEE